MNHFIIAYPGNKRREVENIMNNIDFTDVKNIIEPFCGSSAISFYIWKKYGNKFNYFLNDNCRYLNMIYTEIKNNNIANIINEVNNIRRTIKNKEDYKKVIKQENIHSFIIKNTFYSIRPGMFPINKRIETDKKINKIQYEFINFIKSDNVKYTHNDWENIFNTYKDDKTSLFIFDPPYMQSCNEFYTEDKKLNVYEFFYKNRDIKYKSKIYFILEDNWIIRLLFNEKVIHKYDKKYETSKKNTNHIIIKY